MPSPFNFFGFTFDPWTKLQDFVNSTEVIGNTIKSNVKNSKSALSITSFKTKMDENSGPASSALYKVDFMLPRMMETSFEPFKPETLTIMCQSVTLPGRQIATSELPVYGPPVKMPYGLIYQDFTCSFICTNNMAQRQVFEKWQRSIVDPSTNYVNYYDNYIGTVLVSKLDNEGYPRYAVTYEECYPIGIIEQELSAGNNEFLRLFVQFAYRRWRTSQDTQAVSKTAGQYEIPKPPGDADAQDPKDIYKGTPMPSVPK
jgi:hypothetical protein